MNEMMKTFENPAFGTVRVVLVENDPWFVARDVCDCLGLGNVSRAVDGLDDDEIMADKANITNSNVGMGGRPMTLVSEAGLYELIFKSRKPEAKAFRRWITHEVLPAIRKHGFYFTPQSMEAALANPQMLLDLFRKYLKRENEEALSGLEERLAAIEGKTAAVSRHNEALLGRLRADAPFTRAGRQLGSSSGYMDIGPAANWIRQNFNIDLGRNRLFLWLRNKGWFYKSAHNKCLPSVAGIQTGWFKIVKRTSVNRKGYATVYHVGRISETGALAIAHLLINEANMLPGV